MRIYISGPISGKNPHQTRTNFEAAVREITGLGHEPVNPLANGLPFNAPWREHMKRDIEMMLDCEAVLMLFEWKNSRGCRAGQAVAVESGMPVFYSFAAMRRCLPTVAAQADPPMDSLPW